MAEKTIKAEVYGDSAQAKISKKGQSYVSATLITKDGEGRIESFINASFFPESSQVVKLRDLLCRGREVEVTGNYSEREYEGRDGSQKTAHDILVHSVVLGGVAEYSSENKTTDFSFISDAEAKRSEAALKKQAAKPSAKKPAAQKTTVTAMPGTEPDYDPNLDDMFKDIDL